MVDDPLTHPNGEPSHGASMFKENSKICTAEPSKQESCYSAEINNQIMAVPQSQS